ncbi:MAG TPA: cupin domain-containing protein [Gemmatimonadaceae bacterium]|jgi:mannose-6-phosphate isomerase-like protein (cupin superfamily)|nr:cupin domain-containing protein [Gemmatimonadaceae bacterium]
MSEQSATGQLQKVTLAEKFARIDDHWNPRIVGELNGQHVKLVKIQGAFDWHHHDNEDELFFVHRGSFRMELRDRTVDLSPGDLFIVPRGVEHRPVSDEETELLLFEPASTLNTGNLVSDRTVRSPSRL